MNRPGAVALAAQVACAAVLLAACGAGAGADAAPKSWSPQPSFGGEGQIPAVPGQPQDTAPGSTPQPSSQNSSPATDPAVVATKLNAPDAIAILPDNTALVGERTTGRIVRVLPQPGQPVTTVRTIGGLDTSGNGGLLDLALSPDFAEDNLVFALITTRTDARVVDFTPTGPVTPVYTGIAKPSGPGGRIAFGDDGQLYVGTAGRVLRLTDVGRPAGATPGSPVFTTGHAAIAGLCLVPTTNRLLEVESRGAAVAVNLLAGGADYGYPKATPASQRALTTLPGGQSSPGGCAVLNNVLYVTSKDGKDIVSAQLTQRAGGVTAGGFATLLRGTYGRLDTIVAAGDGALWLTTSNRDGHGRPIAADERVLRILPSGGAASAPV